MTEISTGLTFVEAPPERPKRAGGAVGRPSPFTNVLAQLRDNPGRWAQITTAPIDEPGKETKSSAAARRIAAGSMKGVVGGEFETSYKDGHVFAMYVGQAGIDAYAAAQPERDAAKAARAAKRAAKNTEAAPVATPAEVVAEPTTAEPELVGAGVGAAATFSDQW